MSARARYARVLRTPHVLPLMASALVARLPIGIDSLAIVLFLRDRTGSYATAGVVSAAFALGSGAGAPLSGRLIDRFGQRGVLVPLALVHTGALATLVGLVSEKKVTQGAAKQVLDRLVAEGGDPAAIVQAEGLGAIGGDDALEPAVQAALDANPDIAERLRAGDMKPIGVIVGHVMRETRGRADGGEVTRLVREKLGL